jgi:hypothetical protein
MYWTFQKKMKAKLEQEKHEIIAKLGNILTVGVGTIPTAATVNP